MVRFVRNNRLAAGIIALTIISAGIFVAIVMLFLSLNERRQDIQAGVREDAVWAAYQADREANRLIEALVLARDSLGPERLDAVVMRYDILYSRASILSEAKFKKAVGGDDKVFATARNAHAAILDLAPTIDALDRDFMLVRGQVDELIETASHIRSLTGELAQIANAANNEGRVMARRKIRSTYQQMFLSVGLLTLALILIVTLLGLQLRQLSRNRRVLEELSERNARTAEEAQAGNRAKSMFLAAMSHEIRTPLNGLIGTAEVLSQTELTPDQSRQVATIRHSGNLLLDVISDVLDFSKLEAGETAIIRERFDLAVVLDPLRELLAPRAEAAKLDFSISAPEVSIHSDPSRVRQVLINLVNNAIKFTPKGSVSVKVLSVGEDAMRFEIHDTGVGIKEEDVPKLFLEFSQVDSGTTRQFGGTGLGLAICRQLVEAMGGRIGVNTTANVGSVFWFQIPEVDAHPIACCSDAKMVSRPKTAIAQGRILVIEDNPINRDVVCELLEQLGSTTLCAKDGVEGMDAVFEHGPDLVFMDMQMPRLDGLEATRRLRASGVKKPIIGLTANAFTSDRQDCLVAGMNDFVAKPVTREKLIEMLDRWLPAAVADSARAAPHGGQRAALEADLGADYVQNLLDRFVDQASDLMRDLRAAIGERDIVRRDRVLHKIKGSALTLGLDEIAAVTTRCRSSHDQVDIDHLAELIAAVPVGRCSAHW